MKITLSEIEQGINEYKRISKIRSSEAILNHFIEIESSIIETTKTAIKEYKEDNNL